MTKSSGGSELTAWSEKLDVMQCYNLTAHIYDMRYIKEQTAKIGVIIESIDLKEKNLVLDVGCGTGVLFSYVTAKAKEIIGLDISKEILLQAKQRKKTFGNVQLVLADADNMPLKENTFNYVFAITLIQNSPDPLKTLNAIKKVAREDAIVVVTGLKKSFPVEAFERLLQAAGLNIKTLKSEGLKCHVAFCKNPAHKREIEVR